MTHPTPTVGWSDPMQHGTIRPTLPEDADAIVHLTAGTGVFKPHEIETLREVLGDYFSGSSGPSHRCHTMVEEGKIVGFEYHAPTPMTEGSWHLYWIAVEAS